MTDTYLLTITSPDDLAKPPVEAVDHLTIHSTRAKAMSYLAAYCRDCWVMDDEGVPPISADDAEVIEKLYECNSQMSYSINELPLDPAY